MSLTDTVEFQRDHEARNAELGALRYLEAQEKKAAREGFDKRDNVQKIIRGALPILSAALEAWAVEMEGKAARRPFALGALRGVGDMDKVAYAALSVTFARVAKGEPLPAIAVALGRLIQIELEAVSLTAADSKAASKFIKLVEGGSSLRKSEKRHEVLMEELKLGLLWSQRSQFLVGGGVLNVLLESLSDIFERAMGEDSRGHVAIIRLTEEALATLAEMAEALAWTRPILRPMVSPPRKWTHIDSGAYLDPKVAKTVPLVRTYDREHKKLIKAAIKDGTARPFLDAINGIQDTRWAIDRRVLEVARWVKERGLQTSSSFPLTDIPVIPPRMEDEEWAALAPDARVAKTRERHAKRNLVAASVVNSKVFDMDIHEATRLSLEPVFYLPHSVDSRGRVYAVPHFNPQRADHIKALFRFADSVPMGRDGGFWLAVHLANCGDFKTPSGLKASKAPFAERVQWVEDNEAMVLACARDPQGSYAQWAEADSPFCFLQACFEWAEYAASGYSQDFPGSIAVALDGSCSGLQHYSAMNRAEEEGFHVNLLPRPDVGDIYGAVAASARPMLEALAAGGDLPAKTILANEFGRGTLKRNTMTYFYGSGVFGMRDQHMVDLMRPLADEVALGRIDSHPYSLMTERTNKETKEVTVAPDGGFSCAALLAKTAHAAIVRIAPKADQAASWFQGVAALLAHESLPVIWTTPMGLPVVQRYCEFTSKRVNLWMYDRRVLVPTGDDIQTEDGKVLTRVRALLREAPTKRIDKKKARSAIAPNVVHSLDAAHLQRVVTKAMAEGFSHFQLIHDSFGTHAGNTERFSLLIREAFVEQYETYSPFEALEGYARSVLSEEGLEKLDALNRDVRPQPGALDLKDVLKAKYAFA